MYGNVWEWCLDWHAAAYYQVSPSQDPTGPTQGDTRVLRDGDGRVAQPVVAARHVWAIRLQWVTQTPGFACCC